MSETALAPRGDTTRQSPQSQEPFASSNLLPTPIRAPPPCARIFAGPPRTVQAHVAATTRPKRYSSYRHDSDSTLQTDPAMFGSFSSTGSGSSIPTTPASSIDLEKSSIARDKELRHSSKAGRDLEKAMSHARTHSHQRQYATDPGSFSYANDESDRDARRVQENNAVRILLFLSGPCVLLSGLNMLWAFLSVLITVFSQPVRICAKRPTFGQQLAGLLGPALNLQLRAIYTPLPPHANEDTTYRTDMLMAVFILSPFLSLGIMFSAWVVAFYWLLSAMLGDPAGLDKRDDGRDTVLGLRRWWERWLMRSVIEQ